MELASIENLTYDQLEQMSDEALVLHYQQQNDQDAAAILLSRYQTALENRATAQASFSGVHEDEYMSQYLYRFGQAISSFKQGANYFGKYFMEDMLKFANIEVSRKNLYRKLSVTDEDGSSKQIFVQKLDVDAIRIDQQRIDGKMIDRDGDENIGLEIVDNQSNVEREVGLSEGLLLDYLYDTNSMLYRVAKLISEGYGYEEISDAIRGTVDAKGKEYKPSTKRTWTTRKVEDIRNGYAAYIHINKVTSILRNE